MALALTKLIVMTTTKGKDKMIKKYIKRPIVVEAMLYTGDREGYVLACDFMGERISPERVAKLAKSISLYIECFDGLEYVPKGNYIIKHPSGKITCCSSDGFEDEYSEVLGEE